MDAAINTTKDCGNLTTELPQVPQTNALYLAYNIYLGLCMVLGLVLNMFVILVQFKNEAKTSNDWFVMFINIYDFIISTLVIPVYLTYTTGLWNQFGNDVICKVHMAMTHFTIFASAFLIVGLSLERYLKVCKTTKCKLSKQYSRNACIIVSIVTFVFSVPSALVYDNTSGRCGVITSGVMQQVHKMYYSFTIVVFIVAFILVIFSYSNISITIMKSKTNLAKYSSGMNSDHTKMNCVHCIKMLCCGQLNSNITSTANTYQEPTESGQNSSVFVLPECAKGSAIEHENLPRELRYSNLRETQLKFNRRLKTTRLTLLLCFIFVLTWTPPWVWYAVANFVKPDAIPNPTFMACICSSEDLIL